MEKPIDIAIRIVAGNDRGCVAEAARHFGVSAPYVWKMKKTGHIPVEQVRPIEDAIARAHENGTAHSDETLTAEQMRPDIFRPPSKAA